MTTVSVVVCTRERPDDCRRALDSVLRDAQRAASGKPVLDVEILLVDQSRDHRTRAVVENLGSPLIRYLTMEGADVDPRSPVIGAAAGRNRGARAARGDLLLFVDDDVEVLSGWFDGWRHIVSVYPDCAAFFGEVLPPGPLAPNEFVAEFPVPRAVAWGRELFRLGFDRVGLSANMALRRGDFEALHGLDGYLGPGSPFRASEDLDLGYRVVASGSHLLHAPGTSVLHHGKRVDRDASRLTAGYQLSIGAMLAKHARLGDPYARRLLFGWGVHLSRKVCDGLVHGRRPLGLRDLLGYLQGIRGSFGYSVDPRTTLYRPRAL